MRGIVLWETFVNWPCRQIYVPHYSEASEFVSSRAVMESVALSAHRMKLPSSVGISRQNRSACFPGFERKSRRAALNCTRSESSTSVSSVSTSAIYVAAEPYDRNPMLTDVLRNRRLRVSCRYVPTPASCLQRTMLVRTSMTVRERLPLIAHSAGSAHMELGSTWQRVSGISYQNLFLRRGHGSRLYCVLAFSSDSAPLGSAQHPRFRLQLPKICTVHRCAHALSPVSAESPRHKEHAGGLQPQNWIRNGLDTESAVATDRAPLRNALASSQGYSLSASSHLPRHATASATANGSVLGYHMCTLSLPQPNCFLPRSVRLPCAPGCWRSAPATTLGGAPRFFSSRFRRPLPFSGKTQQSTRPAQQHSRPDGSPGPSQSAREPPRTPPPGSAERTTKFPPQTRLHRGTPGPATGPRMDVARLQPQSKQEPSPSFAQQFLNDKLLGQDKLQFTKVSEKGTADALFAECLESIRHRRFQLDPDVDNRSSEAVEKLTQEERAIAAKIFQRVDPERKIAPRLESRGCYIDPLWDPFKRVEELQQQVAQDLTEFAKVVGAAEARRQRLLVRASLRRQYRMHDPLSEGHRRFFGAQRADPFPTPHRVHERFWDPSPDVRVALKNNNVPISWRDLHILHHFVGENGLILPRRTTHASRYQQRCIFKAICMARRMALFPYDWKPTQGELMPVMDPLQYLVDELTSRYKATGDLRADAMLCVMLSKYPKLNYFRYLQYKAQGQKAEMEAMQQQDEEDRGDFSRLLRKYKRAATDQESRYQPATSV